MYLSVLQLINYCKYTIRGGQDRVIQGNIHPFLLPPFPQKSTRQGALSHDRIHMGR